MNHSVFKLFYLLLSGLCPAPGTIQKSVGHGHDYRTFYIMERLVMYLSRELKIKQL